MKGRLAIVVLLLSLGTICFSAPSANLDSLASNSPFSGRSAPLAAASTPDSSLEFRSIMVDRGETFFSFYDAATRSSLWVGLNEPGNPFVVQQYDSRTDQVVVQHQGRTLTLSLKQAKVVALAATAAPPPSASNQSPSVNQPAAVAPVPPADEARRLAAVADEIRRRRALRQQATQANTVPPGRN